jgi:pyruvate/2-oxoglutarate dehydrogenase complex dihydrolipoamide acyltransferase (E2) component
LLGETGGPQSGWLIVTKSEQGYRVLPISASRRIVGTLAAVCREQNTIYTIIEVDITEPRRLIRLHQERTGERLSLTAYVVASLARTVAELPGFNAIRIGSRLVVLEDVTVGVPVERKMGDEAAPVMIGIHSADTLTVREIGDQIRADEPLLDALARVGWIVRLIPRPLLKAFMRRGMRTLRMAQRYGVLGVTSVGMFGPSPMWLVPLSGSTVAVAVGSIVSRPVTIDGTPMEREHLCLTVAFDHELIDGAPAARFTKRFAELIAGAAALADTVQAGQRP